MFYFIHSPFIHTFIHSCIDSPGIDQWPDISGVESVWDTIAPLSSAKHAPSSKDAAASLAQHQRERERKEERRLAAEREKQKEEAERKKREEEAK